MLNEILYFLRLKKRPKEKTWRLRIWLNTGRHPIKVWCVTVTDEERFKLYAAPWPRGFCILDEEEI